MCYISPIIWVKTQFMLSQCVLSLSTRTDMLKTAQTVLALNVEPVLSCEVFLYISQESRKVFKLLFETSTFIQCKIKESFHPDHICL